MIIIEATTGRDWPHLGVSIKPGVNKFTSLPPAVLTVCESLRSGGVIKMTDTKAKAARESDEAEPEQPSDTAAEGETAPTAASRKKRRGGRSRADLRAGIERANGSPGGGE